MGEKARQNPNKEKANVNRRNILKTLGIGVFASAGIPVPAVGQNSSDKLKGESKFFAAAAELKSDSSLRENDIVRTGGFHRFSDGGHAEYLIQKTQGNTGGSLILKNNLFANLINVSSVNYKMFGAVGDGKNDDGVQIQAAHIFANQNNLPIVNLTGEYWIKDTNNISIRNNVEWGNTIFHIDEKFNTPKASRFTISGTKSPINIDLSPTQKAAFLKQLKPGVRVIPELSPYSNCLVIVADKNDQIGFRSGAKYTGQSWAREEFFVVEEHGRIIGDIAWEFKDYTKLVAIPLSDTYLTVDGGAFYLSGDSGGKGYTKNGFSITRSRTTIRNQWVGLEPGKSDTAPNPRSGFYTFSQVYDVMLENVRLIPYEQDREGEKNDVPAGTYGISAGRMLNGTFRNVTAEGGSIHWGVFGTNLNKNFKIENSKLNRVDVHFHCWNLHIKDSRIGYRGIAITGGGDLLIENSICENPSFINFRRDFGAKWDGNIRIHNCRFIPSGTGRNAVLDFNPMDFDYKYPVGFGRSIIVENLVIDYTGSNSSAVCWLMATPQFSAMKHGQRLFFPNFIQFRNISVVGREAGVRLLKTASPAGFDAGKKGSYDGAFLEANSQLFFENVQLEDLSAKDLSSKEEVHFQFGKNEGKADQVSLYPKVKFSDCTGLVCDFGNNASDVHFERCSINRLVGSNETESPGRLSFMGCSFQPAVKSSDQILIGVASELGTSFTNCTIHAPKVNGISKPESVNQIGFININKWVRFNHLNTLLGRDIINYYRRKNLAFKPSFIAMLKSHHELESDALEGAVASKK